MELCITEIFICVYSQMKPPMKNKCYNAILKFITEQLDILPAACTCPAG